MDMKNTLKGIAIGSLAALTLAAGLTMATLPAFAQGDDATPAAPTTDWRGADSMEEGEQGRHSGPHGFAGGERGDRLADLSEQLGLSVVELQAAQQAAREQSLARALADGRISQEQADLMTAGQALREYVDRETIMAGAMGITVDELTAAREDGSLRDLMASIDRDELHASMQEAIEAAVAQAVADGVITQEQADLLAERGGPGGRGDHRGARGK
jgi:lambda repressor-like predicted transcriptional regulator